MEDRSAREFEVKGKVEEMADLLVMPRLVESMQKDAGFFQKEKGGLSATK